MRTLLLTVRISPFTATRFNHSDSCVCCGPLYDVFSNANGSGLSVIVTLASIALGYGIPYSFLSGFEVADDEAVEEDTGNPVQGGIEADLADDENAEDTAFEESEEVETEEASEDEGESTDETDNGEDA